MKKDNTNDISPLELEALLREATVREGACVPETPSELEALEEKLAGQTFVLPKFAELLARLGGKVTKLTKIVTVTPHFDQDVIEDLAMAARNGGEIPAEVREKMDADRADAESREDK